ncbi:hypothetical protein [Metabacillus iocasae]|uniref:UPF0738 protein JOC83_001382 n=1 Tax=Priestia iocasae TaxID=2291674 RepID=A0ABS2QTD4_9BACI|nr:hypothetical protein [Metabacillus iocasae]MBM7702548.1 hypothetical protein [Metabacillus iocasae]
MQKRIEVTKSYIEENTLYLQTEEFKHQIKNVQDTMQMITDSDNVSFIYILDVNDEFVYVSIPASVWPNLKDVLHSEQKIVAIVNEHKIELEGLKEELEYLISNIEGNTNYGEEMVSKVEALFLDK